MYKNQMSTNDLQFLGTVMHENCVSLCLQLLVYVIKCISYVPSILALLVMGKLFFQFDIQASVWCDYLIGIWTQYLMFDAKESIELNKIYKINAILN